ncbi:MAG TPA: VOC family protein [Bdellovibrionales bacterium]|nr:VOC family protein [Bdellovibrionales bacterium]
MQRIYPCIWLNNQADEAAKLYTSTFENSRIGKVTHYGESGADVSGMPKGSVLTVDLEIAGCHAQLLNGGSYYQQTPSVSLFVTCGSKAEVDKIFGRLSPGGKVLMELGEYPFSQRYVFFSDKFGVHWQLMFEEGANQKVIPSIIFGGDKKGFGAKAVDFYLSLFKNSRKLVDERYKKGEGGKEGSVKHARLSLDGSELVIMDSGHDAPMTLNGAISLVVTCKDQAEVDRFWDAIRKAGKEVQCGWIEDEFGVSWQIVPAGLESILYSSDAEKSERATAAMLQMKKLDINVLKRVYAGA